MSEKKKVESEEKYFLRYIKELCPVHGVFGPRDRWDNQGNGHQLVKGDQRVLILDSSFRITYEARPAFIRGNFSKKTEAAIKATGEYPGAADTRMRMRTETTVDEFIANILTHNVLTWYGNFYVDGKRVPMEEFDVEPNSPEFEELKKTRDAFKFRKRFKFDYDKDDMVVQYHMFNGPAVLNGTIPHPVDQAKLFYEKNTSITPMQDAMNAVLLAHGEPVGEPITLGCTLPVMKDIDYTSFEDIVKESDVRRAEFKKNMTPETRASIQKALDNLKK